MSDFITGLIIILILGAVFCLGGAVGKHSEGSRWRVKFETKNIIAVNNKTYKITEVVATTTYTEK